MTYLQCLKFACAFVGLILCFVLGVGGCLLLFVAIHWWAILLVPIWLTLCISVGIYIPELTDKL